MTNNSISDVLASLKDEFIETLPERLESIESNVLSLKDDSDVESLLRDVHSLKGAAGSYGFHIVTKICHQMEDMMRDLIESNKINSQEAIDKLLAFNDLLNTALDIVSSNSDNFSIIDLKLNQLDNTVGTSQKKILIAEPSPLYAAMIESILRNEGFQIKVVGDGLAALEHLMMQNYDTVITAMELPVLNGDALISALRISNGKNKNIKTILVTSKDINKIEHTGLFNHIVARNGVADGDLKSVLV